MERRVIQGGSSTDDHRRFRAIATELGVISSVFLLYRWGRMFTQDADGEAMRNARSVIDFERALGIFSERTVQGWTLGSHWLVDVLNRYYVLVHFPVTIAFLVWMYLRHHTAYRFVRTWFVAVTLSALVIHVGFPLAPPRMTSGFVDTLRMYGPRIYSNDPRRSVANQFAAMPSLHFGWAFMLACGFVAIKRSRRSVVVLVHPAITLLAIVATGNHYWIDAIIAGFLAVSVAVVLLVWRLLRTGQLTPVSAPAVEMVSVASLAAEQRAVLAADQTDVRQPSAGRRHERCRQHTSVGHERIEIDECAPGAWARVDHPPG